MKKSTKLLFGIAVALVLMISCAFTVFAYTDSECPHYDSYHLGNDEYYCNDCGSYYFDSSYSSSSSYSDDVSSSAGDFEEVLPIAIGAVVLTLLAPWIILGVIIFGLFIPTITTIIINLIIGIILFIAGAIIFILTPVIILVGVPVLVISLI